LSGPQKGASPEQVDALTRALRTWADVVEHELGSGERLRERPGAGSAGGLGFGLLVGLGARLVEGSRAVGEYLADKDTFGTVSEGSRADLILLDANPLEDIMNVFDRTGVMVRGRWLSEAEIQDRLAALAESYD
ncbi:MAG: glycerate kinase, partial [Rhodothermales bacterium]